jgi:hypothetical protein
MTSIAIKETTRPRRCDPRPNASEFSLLSVTFAGVAPPFPSPQRIIQCPKTL